MQQPQYALIAQLGDEKIEAGRIAGPGRLGELATKTNLEPGLRRRDEDDGDDVVVAALAANAAEMPPVAAITATCRRTNSAARRWQSIDFTPRPSGIQSPCSRPRHSPGLFQAPVDMRPQRARRRSRVKRR